MNPKSKNNQYDLNKGSLIQLGLILLSFLPLASMQYFGEEVETQEVVSVNVADEFINMPYIARP